MAAAALVLCFAAKKLTDRATGAITIRLGHPFDASGIRKLLCAFIIAVALCTILQMNGVNVTTAVAGLGIAGIIVGFSIQSLLNDVITGIGILADGFFTVGDTVEYAGRECEVIGFNLKTTKLMDAVTRDITTVSNRNISEIKRLSEMLDVIVPAPYSEPAEKMRRVCRAILDRCAGLPGVTGTEFLGTDAFLDSQISYLIRVVCPPSERETTRRAVLGTIQDVFAEENIDIPFNQLDVHIN